MDSAQLYQKLVESGDRLLRALSNARKQNNCNRVGPGWRRSLGQWISARREVEETAELYAAALRTYRIAMLSELGALPAASGAMLGRVSRHRERVRVVSKQFGDSGPVPAVGRGNT